MKWQGWSKDFLGYEIFDFGIFWVWKFWQVLFLVAWFKLGIFFGIQNNLKIRDSSCVSWLHSSSGNFCGSEIWQEIFWGLNFGPGIFWGFDFCSHSIIPVTWNLDYPPPGFARSFQASKQSLMGLNCIILVIQYINNTIVLTQSWQLHPVSVFAFLNASNSDWSYNLPFFFKHSSWKTLQQTRQGWTSTPVYARHTEHSSSYSTLFVK